MDALKIASLGLTVVTAAASVASAVVGNKKEEQIIGEKVAEALKNMKESK